MNAKNRYLVLISTLIVLGLLAVLSVWGAFAGARRAGEFFNSLPMAVFWVSFVAILAGGFVVCRGLQVRPWMLITHAGLVLILVGGLWGSEKAHELRGGKPYKGYLFLYEGTSSDTLRDENANPIAKLPFRVGLEKFAIEFYGEKEIQIVDKSNPQRGYRLPAEGGATLDLDDAKVRIRAFNNLQLRGESGSMQGHEGPPEQSNPGYELTFEYPDGRREIQFVYERFAGHDIPRYRYLVSVIGPQMVKDYISTLAVETGDGVQARKAIEVNKPLHYGGFHFYQSDWGESEADRYSVIQVTSDSGLAAVFVGYGLLSLGIMGQFWLAPVVRYFSRRKGVRCGD